MGGCDHCFIPFSLVCFPFISLSITHEEGKKKLNTIVKFEGSERTNSTHTPHTHTVICMHSRVAAVNAPRTHNRRRVAGSSGRRREGRESQRQRPNMSRRVFTSAVLLLLVLMMCCNTCEGAAQAAEDPPSGQGTSKTYFVWRDTKSGETVESLHVPSLVEMNGEVFAVAEAQLRDESGFTGISSKLLALNEKQKMELDQNKLETQVLEECPSENDGDCHIASQADSQSRTKVEVRRPTTVVNGGHIYMLAGNYSRTASADGEESGAVEWGLLLVKGNVSTGQSGSEKRIQWNESQLLVDSFSADEHKSLTQLIGGGGSGVKTTGGTLVFPVEAKKKGEKNEENSKTVLLILYSPDNKSWTLSKEIPDDGCSNPSVVEWKEKNSS
ncbi:trans-sialidase, putative [Trypanosoma cruzi marinkellei]|uniref:Trans-sialidase, putative n=1 Tax=Trypanosoma cruzi marinkellei TaxID=85056 RepID=K2M0C2_TRYCR|nr:trans-sialidase, putative [Trypanosoma cruzi marinkellei]